eukprot:3706204-Pleurochrysis_carterae.AAC.2
MRACESTLSCACIAHFIYDSALLFKSLDLYVVVQTDFGKHACEIRLFAPRNIGYDRWQQRTGFNLGLTRGGDPGPTVGDRMLEQPCARFAEYLDSIDYRLDLRPKGRETHNNNVFQLPHSISLSLPPLLAKAKGHGLRQTFGQSSSVCSIATSTVFRRRHPRCCSPNQWLYTSFKALCMPTRDPARPYSRSHKRSSTRSTKARCRPQ